MASTLLEAWQSFERHVVPAGASAIQREECRRAFYAGAVGLRKLIDDAVEPLDEAENQARLQALDDELNAFPKDLRF